MLPHMIGLVMAAQGAAQAAAAPAGPNPDVWAAPAGLTLVHMAALDQTLGGNIVHSLSGDSSGVDASATVTSPPLFVAGDQYDYSVLSYDTRDGDDAELNIGGAIVTLDPFGTYPLISSVTIPTPAVQILRTRIFGNADEESPSITLDYVRKH